MELPWTLPCTYLSSPQHLNQIINKLQNNEERLSYAFYISDEELIAPLETYLQKNKVSVEKVLPIVCQPQAIFHIRPVNRCSATISGHAEVVLSVAFSPDGRQLDTRTGYFVLHGHWMESIL